MHEQQLTRPRSRRTADLETLKLTSDERAFLERRCPYLPAAYLDFLASYRFRPDEQVKFEFVSTGKDDQGIEWGSFELEIKGKWVETILYEVSLAPAHLAVALRSKTLPCSMRRTRCMGRSLSLRDSADRASHCSTGPAHVDYLGGLLHARRQGVGLHRAIRYGPRLCDDRPELIGPRVCLAEQARQKGHRLFEAGCVLSEFGSRRRRTYKAHDIVMRGLIKANEECGNGKAGQGGKLAGTSNLHFAHKYDLVPIGTVRHLFLQLCTDVGSLTRSSCDRSRTSSSWALRRSKVTRAATAGRWTCGRR